MIKHSVRGLIVLYLLAAGAVYGQSTNSGDIRGTVTDQSGAVIPNAEVIVTDVDKGTTQTFITNSSGVYDTNSITPDNYTVTFAAGGFTRLVRGPITVNVGITPLNAQLTIGSETQQVVVTSDAPLLKTETAEQSTVLESKVMDELPNVGQDWENFVKQIPGAQNAPGQNAGFFGSSTSGGQSSVNGNLPFSNFLADGASTTLPAASNSDITVQEAIQQVQIITSTFSAQYGIGGVIFNQISKSGTSRFHGSIYDYFRNSALNAATYSIVPGTRASKLSPLRYNNFGATLGGPILSRKLFFFFDYDKNIQNGNANQGTVTVPTTAMLSGDFTGQPIIYDPATTKVVNGIVTRQSFADEYGNGNRIPQSRIDPVARAIQAYYPQPSSAGTAGSGATGSGVVTNNYSYNAPNPFGWIKFFGRADYDVTKANRLTASVSNRHVLQGSNGIGICPVNCYSLLVDSYNAQISDVATLSPRLINELRLTYTDQFNYFTPQTFGGGFPQKLGWKFAATDTFPDIQISGACCTELRPNSSQILKQHVYSPSDVVTYVRGKHIFRFGGEFSVYRLNETLFNNLNGGTMAYNGQYTRCTDTKACASTGGIPYADFLLGLTQGWNANVSPLYHERLSLPQLFVQDDFKLRPNLTINLGLRYQVQKPWHEKDGNVAVFDPTVSNPATGTLGAYWYGSTKANGRQDLQKPVYSTVLPRLGLSYSPRPNMTIRGGYGLYAYSWSESDYGSGDGLAFGNKGNITDTTGYNPVVVLSSTGSTLPLTPVTTNPAAYNGQNVTGNLYDAPVPKIHQWNLAVQEQLGNNTVVEIAYVGSHGFNLPFPVDLNQVPETLLSPTDTVSKPFTQYGYISTSLDNARSNYNSLQTVLSRRLSNGMSFNFNYAWSHFLDTEDSSGWGGRSGAQTYQRASNPDANYGNSNFDVRNSFKGTMLYQLPFGQGRMFLNHNRLLDLVVGGWQASTTFQVQTGNPFTAVISSARDTTYSRSIGAPGYAVYPNVIASSELPNRSRTNWFNVCTQLTATTVSGPAGCTPVWSVPAPGTFGNSHRNQLRNPSLSNVNLSASKIFKVRESLRFQLKADAQNAFNHPTLAFTGNVAVDSNNSAFTSVLNPGRSVQLAAKLIF